MFCDQASIPTASDLGLNCRDLFIGYTSLTRSNGDRKVGSVLGFQKKVDLVFQNLSFDLLFEQRRVAIVGSNGSGKTTLLRALAGVIPSKGQIVWGSSRVDDLTSMQRRKMGLVFIPHENSIFPDLSVRGNLTLMRASGRASFASVDMFLDEFMSDNSGGVEALRFLRSAKRAGDLSGGQRKLLSLMRLFFSPPRLVLIDEPTAGLSPLFIDLLGSILNHLHKDVCILAVDQYSSLPILRTMGFASNELAANSLQPVGN